MIGIIFETIAFLFFLFFCVYLPGKFLIARLGITLDSLQSLWFSVSVGLVVFLLVSYIAAWLKWENLILPFFLVIDFWHVRKNSWVPQKPDKKHWVPLTIVSAFSLLFSVSMLVTGIYGNTINYRTDDQWHLALINELKAHFPPDHPGLAEVPLRGYHFFYDFFIAKISSIFFISPMSLHFHLFPLLTALLWGVGVYVLMVTWSKRISAGLWAVFLTMFGGNFAFVFRLQGHTNFNLGNGLGIPQPTHSLYNPPFATSIIILIPALFALYQYLSTKKKAWLVPLVLYGGIISMVKVYAGMILIGGILLVALMEAVQKKTAMIIALTAIGMIFWGTYWVFVGNSGSLLFFPLWAPHKILQSFPWYGYDEKIYTYTRLHVIRGVIETELYGLKLFILGNLGTRLIGILLLPLLFLKNHKLPSLFAFVLFAMGCAALATPLFFIQSGRVFEIIQMAQYYLFFFSLFAALGFSVLFEKRFAPLIKVLLFLFISIATVPSAYENFLSYYQTLHSAQSLSSPYFQTMNFLAKQGTYNDTVLEMPSKEVITDKELASWYYDSSPAVTAFGNKRGYFNNEINDSGPNVQPRLDLLKKLIAVSHSSTDNPDLEKEIRQMLATSTVRSIYSPYEIPAFPKKLGLTKIYQNEALTLYKLAL